MLWNKKDYNQEQKKTLNITPIALPYLESNYNSLAYLKEKIQIQLSLIKKEIDNLNAYFKEISFYHSKTFENLSDNNWSIVTTNIRQNTKLVANGTMRAIKIIENINW